MGQTNVLRFYSEVRDSKTFVLSAPLLIWAQKIYQTMALQAFEDMVKQNSKRKDLYFCGINTPNQVVLNCGNAQLHDDPVDTSLALLSYYWGPFDLPWLDGELKIHEALLQIEPSPRDAILLDGALYHNVNSENGERFNTTIYNKNLTENGVLPEQLQWTTEKYFGFC